jgi:hypothetical protein
MASVKRAFQSNIIATDSLQGYWQKHRLRLHNPFRLLAESIAAVARRLSLGQDRGRMSVFLAPQPGKRYFARSSRLQAGAAAPASAKIALHRDLPTP